MDKHCRSIMSRAVLDTFFEAQRKATIPEEVPPTIANGKQYLISVYREKLFYIGLVQTDVPPLFVMEFLHRVADVFTDYFENCNEKTILANLVTIYQILEEMLDSGFPLMVEPNILKELIKPPSWIKALDNLTGNKAMKEVLPTGQLSHTSWRRQDVKHNNNEIFVDLIECLDVIMDKNGSLITAEIRGKIACKSKLSGMPDLTLSFVNGRLLDDVSFHPCVRLARWEKERVLSFVPPDGDFVLASYAVGSQCQFGIPLHVRPSINFSEQGHGRIDVELSLKSTGGQAVEEVVLTCQMPKVVNSVSTNCSFGSQIFDQVNKTLKWRIGKLPMDKAITMKGTISCAPGQPIPDGNPALMIEFKVFSYCSSGVKVNKLDLFGEKYKPFKGVKYQTKSGRYQIRT